MSAPRAYLAVREDLCVGCFACEVACKQEHELPVGPRLIRVRATEGSTLPRSESGGRPAGSAAGPPWFLIDVCRHCDDPACVAACPTGAVAAEAGRVSVDASLCSGCQDCAAACPYGATWFDPADGTLQLCDLCWSRVTAGMRPACVHHCPADALALSTADPRAGAGIDDDEGGSR